MFSPAPPRRGPSGSTHRREGKADTKREFVLCPSPSLCGPSHADTRPREERCTPCGSGNGVSGRGSGRGGWWARRHTSVAMVEGEERGGGRRAEAVDGRSGHVGHRMMGTAGVVGAPRGPSTTPEIAHDEEEEEEVIRRASS